MKQDPKIIFATIPLRDPSSHIPIASLAIMSALQRHGYTNLMLYEINVLRPQYEETLEFFRENKPDIVGLSAVVSTSYAYVKELAADLRKLLPDVLIVCGGNMAANANVLLAKTEIDICCTGEGENTMCNIVDSYVAGTISPETLANIKGVAFLDSKNSLVVTDFEPQLLEKDIFNVNWDLADATPGVDRCFSDKLSSHGVFVSDIRYYDPKRRGKSFGRFYASKGCVARCTFCHRFTKGIRYVPIDILESRLDDFIKRYNIGFIYFTDENFGTSPEWLYPFLEMIKKFDVLWGVGGIRVNIIDEKSLKMMYEAGCTSVAYGTETGSEKMLLIMQKKVKLEDNYKITKITPAANLYYSPQMVIGMPGETQETIEETSRFLEVVYSQDEFYHPSALSLNYAQALPGTPLYESGRIKGLIEPTIDGEEKYLLKVSNKNARDLDSTVNHTDSPFLVWRSWNAQLRVSANYAYIKKFGMKAFLQWWLVSTTEYGVFVRDENGNSYYCDSHKISSYSGSYADVKEAIRKMDIEYRKGNIPGADRNFEKKGLNVFLKYPRLMYRLRKLFPIVVGLREIRIQGNKKAAGYFAEYIKWTIRGLIRPPSEPEKVDSLRRLVKIDSIKLDNTQIVKLRMGR